MVRDEAPAATHGGVKELLATALKSASAMGPGCDFKQAVRPASLLRKSILDVSQLASATLAALHHTSCVPNRFG
jgi:hypothetical protein